MERKRKPNYFSIAKLSGSVRSKQILESALRQPILIADNFQSCSNTKNVEKQSIKIDNFNKSEDKNYSIEFVNELDDSNPILNPTIDPTLQETNLELTNLATKEFSINPSTNPNCATKALPEANNSSSENHILDCLENIQQVDFISSLESDYLENKITNEPSLEYYDVIHITNFEEQSCLASEVVQKTTQISSSKEVLSDLGNIIEGNDNSILKPIESLENDTVEATTAPDIENPILELDYSQDSNAEPLEGAENAADSNYEPQGSEEENSENDEIEENVEIEGNEENNQHLTKRGRTRKRKAEKAEWDREKTKLRRMKGEKYMGYSRTRDHKIMHDKIRSPRVLGPTCTSAKCIKYKNLFCNSITLESRQDIFKKFWELDWDQKKIYITSLVPKKQTARKFVPGDSRRSYSYANFLRVNNDVRQVCKKMFLSTLGVREWMVLHWCSQNTHGMHSPQVTINSNRKLERGLTENQQFAETQNSFLRDFFDQLSKMPSHYCRKDSQKLYLEADFGSKTNVYRVYQKYCADKNEKALSNSIFSEIFEKMNLAIFSPKKDQCNICVAYNAGNIEVQEYERHIDLKDKARNAMAEDKIKAEGGQQHVFVMDVQAVKLCPLNNANKFYFKTKLKIHNFTIYNLATHQATNYWWNESEGDLVASVFTSIVIYHLGKYCLDKLPIVLWSDGCPYQNRNVVLSNALSNYSVKYQKLVTQKYLEPGHSQMECDSVHSVIERKLKNHDINLPYDYVTITKNARIKPFPYDAEYLEHTFFKKYDDPDVIRYKSIRPGRVAGDPTVTNIRELFYDMDGKIQFKLDFAEDLSDLPQRFRNIKKEKVLEPLYHGRLKIKKLKYDHLQDIKTTLAKEYHHFYDNLPFE